MEFDKRVIFLLVSVTLLNSCVDSSHISNRLRNNLEKWRPQLLKKSELISGKIVENVGLKTVKTIFHNITKRITETSLTSVKRSSFRQRQYATTTFEPPTTTTVTPSTAAYPFPNAAVIAAIASFATAIAVSVAVAVPLGLPSTESFDFDPPLFIPPVREIPEVHHDMPVRGSDFPDDGCGDFSVRFDDERCYPILRRGPCGATHWVTINPQTLRVT